MFRIIGKSEGFILFALMREMRINQWTKNVLVYAALLFSGELFHDSPFFLVTPVC